MNADINTGLTLLLVGMITVVCILVLVVIFGNLLIRLVNKYFPADELVQVPNTAAPVLAGIAPAKLAAIAAAVQDATGGRGQVTRIEKLMERRD
jgi:oxaloacetate decarboxylase gamma subunit